MSSDAWQVFDLDDIATAFGGKAAEYKEFLRVPALSCGLYRLAAGARDMQTPHDEDEVYLVLEGRARMQVGDQIRTVSRGSVLYVRATESHSFFEIEEDMTLLVFFAAMPTDQGD